MATFNESVNMVRFDEMFNSDVFNFDAFEQNQDAVLAADNHIFNNGPDLFNRQPYNPSEEVTTFTDTGTQDVMLNVSHVGYSDNAFDYLENSNFGTMGRGIEPTYDQLAFESLVAQPGGLRHDWSFDSRTSAADAVHTGTIEPALLFVEDPLYPSTIEFGHHHQQQHGQAAFDGDMQPNTLDGQLVAWQATETESNLRSHSLSEPLPRELPLPRYETFSLEPSPARKSWQAHGSSGEEVIVQDEIVQLLQSVEPNDHEQVGSQQRLKASPDRPAFSSEDHGENGSPKRSESTAPAFRRTQTAAHRSPSPTPYENSITGLAFVSLHDAEVAMSSRHVDWDWKPPYPDKSIPTTQLERSEYVHAMLSAMRETSYCKDNKAGYSYAKRWGRADYYNVREMEKVCWQMLDIAERLHTQGPIASNMYCAEALRKLYASRKFTFEQRITHICSMLEYSKNLCDNLMKNEGIEALVGSPKLKMNGARTMAKQNVKRQKWIQYGRAETQAHGKSANSNSIEQGNIASTPLTRKQKFNQIGPAANTETKTNARPQTTTQNSNLSRRQSAAAMLTKSNEITVVAVAEAATEAAATVTTKTATTAKSFGQSRKHAIDLPATGPGYDEPSVVTKRRRRTTAAATPQDEDETVGAEPSNGFEGDDSTGPDGAESNVDSGDVEANEHDEAEPDSESEDDEADSSYEDTTPKSTPTPVEAVAQPTKVTATKSKKPAPSRVEPATPSPERTPPTSQKRKLRSHDNPEQSSAPLAKRTKTTNITAARKSTLPASATQNSTAVDVIEIVLPPRDSQDLLLGFDPNVIGQPRDKYGRLLKDLPIGKATGRPRDSLDRLIEFTSQVSDSHRDKQGRFVPCAKTSDAQTKHKKPPVVVKRVTRAQAALERVEKVKTAMTRKLRSTGRK